MLLCGVLKSGSSSFPQLSTAVAQHFGETMIRARVAEYVSRFIRIAARYEEGVLGSTSIWFPTLVFSETGVSTATLGLGIPQGFGGSLGSGIVFSDESTSVREVAWNSGRIEGWRLTRCYELWQQVRCFVLALPTGTIGAPSY